MNHSLYNVFTHDLQGRAHYPLKTPRLILCIGSLAIQIWALYSLSFPMLSLTFFRNHDGLCHSDEEMGPSFHNHRVADSGPMNSRLHAQVLTQVLLPSTLLSRIFILNQRLSFEPFSFPVAYPRTGSSLLCPRIAYICPCRHTRRSCMSRSSWSVTRR